MNSFMRCLVIASVGGLLNISAAQADEIRSAPQLTLAAAGSPGTSNPPDNSAIRRANPNSRQGTQSISPNTRGPDLAPTPQRAPTLENGGIGNGYPARQQTPRPSGSTERRTQ